ncbi:MAG: hypothetical protein HZT40_07730 [Candidatus Thiothrix singaporensis]|uniref:Uncharacterized protein n=1 Tax=Candidatus Thiothrix singaporensis TaxID=2799669 RepID=A0A7L6AR22_9GAMM|nr:MAG: hypothetical protein HZT40_07730 [Candidatus Thiothrix singaporensis]
MALIYIIPLINSMANQNEKISCYPKTEKTLNVGSSSPIFDNKYKLYITQADETVCTLKINNQEIEVHGSETQEIDLDYCKYNITRIHYDSAKNACTIGIEPAVK